MRDIASNFKRWVFSRKNDGWPNDTLNRWHDHLIRWGKYSLITLSSWKEAQDYKLLYKGGFTAAQVGQKVTVEVTIHNVMLDLRPYEGGGRHLRHDLLVRFGKICGQGSINEFDLGGTIEFEFKRHYKLQRFSQQKKLRHLWIEQLYIVHILSRALFDLCRAFTKPLNMRAIYFWSDMMASSKEVMDITGMTAEAVT